MDVRAISSVLKNGYEWIKSVGPEGGIWIINEGFSVPVQLTIPKKAVKETVTLTCKFIYKLIYLNDLNLCHHLYFINNSFNR